MRRGPMLAELDLQLTSRCNLDCGFCNVDANGPGARGRLPIARLERLLDEAITLGLRELRLTGGEPTLSPHLEGVVQHARGLGIRTHLITNGTLLDRGRLEELWGLGLRSIVVGVDGLAATHDTMRGKPRSWQRAMATVGHAVDLGFDVRVSAVAFHGNLHELPQLMVLAAQREVGAFSLALGAPLGRGTAWQDRVLGRRAWRAFLAELQHGIRRGDFGDGMAIDAELAWADAPPPTPDPVALCPAAQPGSSQLLMRADGVLFPCACLLHSGPALGDLAHSSLGEVLQHAWRTQPTRHLAPLPAACAPCTRASACGGGCRGLAIARRGDVQERDPRCSGPGDDAPWPLCPRVRADQRAAAAAP